LERLLGDVDLGDGGRREAETRVRVAELWGRLTVEEQAERLGRVARGEVPSLSGPEHVRRAREILDRTAP
jgi:hypothetical protein